jgi:deazaflavin-dependent oxidoreductase (nitroreductase family)
MQLASTAHSLAYTVTRGRVGGRLGRLPILLLTTIGNKTGKRRTTPLVYLRDGDDLVLVASNGGSDRSPSWFWNLRADNHAVVQINGAREPVVATIATKDERDRLWPEVVSLWPGYAGYQQKTKRLIPLVLLHRAHLPR